MAAPARPSVVKWDLSHLGDDLFDAELVRFEGWGDTLNLRPPFDYELPAEICFEANFGKLDRGPQSRRP